MHDGLEAWLVATIPPLMRHLLAHARRLMVSAPVVTRQATALAEAGLVERQPDVSDRRSVRLSLTARGRRRVRAMRRELLAAAGELLAALPGAQREGVATALEQLRVLLPATRR